MGVNRGKIPRKQLGTKSKLGGKTAGKTLKPWGNLVPQATSRRSPATGFAGKLQRVAGSARRKPVQSPLERGMSYPINDPLQWPVVPDATTNPLTQRGPVSGMTQAKADAHNTAVDHAYLRTTGLS